VEKTKGRLEKNGCEEKILAQKQKKRTFGKYLNVKERKDIYVCISYR